MQTITAPSYTRNNQSWSAWIGKKGVVLAVTVIRVAAPEFSVYTPYQYALVDFGEELGKMSYMVASQEKTVTTGDKVICVLRKLSQPSKEGIIEYGIKVSLLAG